MRIEHTQQKITNVHSEFDKAFPYVFKKKMFVYVKNYF